MKLSICMMVKDEERNLHRCLKSLQPLRDKINSELIIVDTGSKDRTVEIAKKYTDRIYFHKWNNNFSDMRNISISYAKGEWIMIIDADEELEDCTLLVGFFDTAVEKTLNTIFMFVKNYAFGGTDYKSGIVKSPRLFRNDGKFRYEGTVHNQPIFKEPTGQLDTMLIHYGYIIDDKQTMERKFIRTRDLLINELKKAPDNVYYLFQLGVTYGMHNEYKKALKELEKAYNIVKEKKLELKNYIYVYNQLIDFYIANELYEEAEKIGEETIVIDKENLDAYFNLGKVKLHFKKFDKGENCYNKYLTIRKNLMNTTNINNVYYTVTKVDEVYLDLAKLNYNRDKFDESIGNLMNIKTLELVEENYKFIVTVFLKGNRLDKFVQFYNENLTDAKKILKDAVIIRLEEELKNFKRDKDEEVLKKLKTINNENYGLLNEMRVDYLNKNLRENKIEECFERLNFNSILEFYGDIIYYAFLLEFPMDKILLNITEKNIDIYFTYLKQKYVDFLDIINECYSEYYTSTQYYSIRFSKIISRYSLAWNESNDEDYRTIFDSYIESGKQFIKIVYSDMVIEDELISDLKNSEEIFFLYMLKAEECKNSNPKLYLSYLENALTEMPAAKRGIEALMHEFEENLNMQGKNREFESYKATVKNTIKALIENNKLDEASEIIGEYEQIVKDDIEIVFFKSQLSLKKLKSPNTNYKM